MSDPKLTDMVIQNTIYITTQFEGFHRWKDAPDKVGFLRDWHRHIFHVKLHKIVSHGNRDIEFIQFKREVEEYLKSYTGWEERFELSCEMLAEVLLNKFDCVMADVSEDGENGGIVMRKIPPLLTLEAPKFNLDNLTVEEIEREIRRNRSEPGFMYMTLSEPVKTSSHKEKEVEFPCMKKREKCFVGIEAEGPRCEISTLFIPEICNPGEVAKVINTLVKKGECPVNVYFGAGNYPAKDNVQSLHVILDFFNERNVTVEIGEYFNTLPQLMKLVLNKFKMISLVSTELDDEEARINYFKIVSDRYIVVYPTESKIYLTLKDAPAFSQDKEVVLD